MIKIYNNLSRKKEEFTPLEDNLVRMYTCGVTVYDDCHIGHGRSLYIFEVIRRYLKFKGFKVQFIRNITDVDDKILNKANELINKGQETDIHKAWQKVITTYTAGYYQDLENLSIDKADIEPRASTHIADILDFIQALMKRGYAYEKNGNVYFRIRKYQEDFKSYGELSGKKDLDELINFVRIEANPDKEDPLDFALWKAKKENEVSWASPWGEGRPGWHIECSVMSMKYLGDTFDIHGGGKDLMFPHHENEIAQAKAKTGKELARFFIHHGLITINSQKMSKSLKNFLTLKEALKKYSQDVLKIFYLSSHYRSPLDFSEDRIAESQRIRERISILIQQLRTFQVLTNFRNCSHQALSDVYNKFIEAMDDDFNMPLGFSLIFELMRIVNESQEKNENFFQEAKTLLYQILELFAIFPKEKEAPPEFIEYVEKKINDRNKFREKKDYAKADAIRDELFKKGIVLEDLPHNASRWRFK